MTVFCGTAEIFPVSEIIQPYNYKIYTYMKMRKTYLTALALCGCGLTASAQQVNGGFDETWESCVPFTYQTNTNTLNTKSQGTEPVGWQASNIKGYYGGILGWTGALTVVTEGTGVSGTDKAAVLTNGQTVGQNVPAYLTLGTPWNTATSSSGANADGGSFGGIDFTYIPDAITLQCKRGNKDTTTQPISVIAYTWKGTFEQENVPVSVVVLNGTPKTITMVDRDRNIMGMTTAKGTTPIKSEGTRIAYLDQQITDVTASEFTTENNDGWSTLVIPFIYDDNAVTNAEKLNIILSAGNYWGDKTDLIKDNSLTVDNVKLLYYHSLENVKYGTTDVVFNSNHKADLGTVEYNAETALSYTKIGMGATVEVGAYNSSTCQQTITVKGNDYNASDAETYTVYTIQYAVPAAKLANVKISGEEYTDFNAATTSYTLPYAYNPGIVIEGVAAEGGTIVTDESGETAFYDNENKTITVKVQNASGQNTDYTFHFTDEVATGDEIGTYQGSLSVILSTEEASMPSTLDNSNIVVTRNSNNTLNILLKDFTFKSMGVYVGDIFLSNVPVTNGNVNTKRTLRLTAYNEDGTPNSDAFGWALGHLPIQINGSILSTTAKEFAASIDIITSESAALSEMFTNIHVDFVPMVVTDKTEFTDEYSGVSCNTTLTATGRVTRKAAQLLQINNSYTQESTLVENPMSYIDLSGAKIDADVTAEDLKTGAASGNNTMIFLPAEATISGDNVICGNTCASLAIKDGVAFSAPKDFTATSVTYDRTLTAGKVSTFVLPFAFTPDANTTVAELASVNGTSLVFKPISTSETVANKPYVIKSTNADALKTFSNVNVKATTGATLTTEVDGYKHIGSYETLTGLTGYGYAGGEFVYTTRGTLNPYRTYITAPAGSEAEAFSLVIDNSTTGLDSVSNAAEGANDCYDLSGRRVARPSKGLYILNGKKVIMK